MAHGSCRASRVTAYAKGYNFQGVDILSPAAGAAGKVHDAENCTVAGPRPGHQRSAKAREEGGACANVSVRKDPLANDGKLPAARSGVCTFFVCPFMP